MNYAKLMKENRQFKSVYESDRGPLAERSRRTQEEYFVWQAIMAQFGQKLASKAGSTGRNHEDESAAKLVSGSSTAK